MDQFKEIESKVFEDFAAQLNFIHSDDKIEMTEKSNQEEVEDRQIPLFQEDDDDDDFSFVFNKYETSPIQAHAVVHDGQIRQVFPLFDRDLLADYYSESSEDRLPHQPPVKVFVESSTLSSSSSASDKIDGVATGPYCVWTKKGKDEKSNSTGFSKLWRFRDFVNRSNSDGRDAFVFLNNSTAKKVENLSEKRPASESSPDKKLSSGEISDNGNGAGGKVKVKKAGKAKTAPISAHEVYMRNKGLHKDRRRSYLPYRPELVGFFTNVHGGLSRNVHPF
ncbi:hypothetical protein LguiB_016207 [Lonicera macranthoides]